MNKLTYRVIQKFTTVLTVLIFFTSFYFQYILGLLPCPLCIMQRFCVFLLLISMGLSFYVLNKIRFIFLLQICIACCGLFFSLRQLWLQSLPIEEVTACMPDLDIILRYFPWKAVLHTLLWGTGDCTEVTWHMLGISMAGWTALYFILMILMGCVLFYSAPRAVK